MWKLVLITLALIQAIQCRTNQDVINDFEPVFRERHEAFSALKNKMETELSPRFTMSEKEMQLMGNSLNFEYFPKYVERINNNITDYIKLIGLDNHPELTKGCMTELKTAIDRQNNTVAGEAKSCIALSYYHHDKISFEYKDLLKKFDNEHAILNVTRDECVKLSTPFEVQTCLINDLYTFYIPYLKDVTEYTNKKIEQWPLDLIKILLEVTSPCTVLAIRDLDDFETRVVLNIEACLWFIPTPTQNTL